MNIFGLPVTKSCAEGKEPERVSMGSLALAASIETDVFKVRRQGHEFTIPESCL